LSNPAAAANKLWMSLTNLVFGVIGVLLGLRYEHPLIGYFGGTIVGVLAYLAIAKVMSRYSDPFIPGLSGTMRKTFPIVIALLACLALPFLAAAATPSLVSFSADGEPGENGKPTKMDFREVSRSADQSKAEVEFHSGGSVSTAMFVMRGFCTIAKARGMRYFNYAEAESESRGNIFVYVGAFANSRTAEILKSKTVTTGKKPDPEDDGIMSLGDCKLLGLFD